MKIVEAHLGSNFRPSRAERALAAALVHDVGHGPFSHAFEKVGKRLGLRLAGRHEDVTDALVRDSEITDALKSLGSGFAADVATVIKGGPVDIYSAVVSSQFDADRLDYMQRDRLMTGTQHSDIDLVWLLANLEVGALQRGVDEQAVSTVETFVLGPKAIYAAEAYVLGLFHLYPTVYFHKATRGAEKIFTELLLHFVSIVMDGGSRKTGLGSNHPLTRFAKAPEKMGSLLLLDDSVVWGALPVLAECSDSTLSDLASRLHRRKLMKALDVRETVRGMLIEDGIQRRRLTDAVNKACAFIGDRIEASTLRTANGMPKILWDEDKREPYRQVDESKGPLNQIRIRIGENLVDLREQSKIVAAIETYQLARAYVRKEDDESAALLQKLIKDGTRHAKRTQKRC
jgi:HD superfamily phosphohydrolase